MVTVAGLGLIVVAMLLVRRGWAGARPLAWAGWALTVAGAILLTVADGAWGLAVGTVAAMATALALVLRAGWASPAKARRPAREAPSITLPRRSGDLIRRVVVFVLAVPIAFAAAQWFAFGIQALARRGGAVEADATVLTLGLQPLAWGVVMTVQMIQPGPVRMLVAPAIAAALGTIAWGLA